jgi:hypothetical protein
MIWVGKIYLGSALLLLGLACSRSVTAPPGGGDGGGVSTLESCSLGTSCKKQGEVCDLLYPSSSGQPGTCRISCDPAAPVPSCGAGQVCNPITAACEPNCNSDAGCASAVASGGTAKCATGNFCVSVPIGSSCPTNFVNSGGFCKLSSSVGNLDYLTSDPITNTLELECKSSRDRCASLIGLNLPGQQSQLTYACSQITGTCVQQCTVAAQGAADPCVNVATRNRCYAPGYAANSAGTCEKGCANSSSCIALTCAEGVCQRSCADDSNCTFENRTRCDVVSKTCAIPCSSSTGTFQPGACTAISAALTCSPVSATCVPSCTSPTGSCPLQDTIRAACAQLFVSNTPYNSCERSCTATGSGVAFGCLSSQSCVPTFGKPPFALYYCGESCLNNQCTKNYFSQCTSASICGFIS